MQDPSHVCELHHSSQPCWILNPLSEARDPTWVLRDTSWVHYRWGTMGTPVNTFICSIYLPGSFWRMYYVSLFWKLLVLSRNISFNICQCCYVCSLMWVSCFLLFQCNFDSTSDADGKIFKCYTRNGAENFSPIADLWFHSCFPQGCLVLTFLGCSSKEFVQTCISQACVERCLLFFFFF